MNIMNPRFKSILAVYLVLLRDNHILLLRRHNTGYEDGNYSLPAGHVEENETIMSALVREAYEEAGIEVEPNNCVLKHVMYRKTDQERADFFFICTSWKGEIFNKEPEKCSDLNWFQLEELPSNTIPYIAKALRCIKEEITYSEEGWEFKLAEAV